MPDRNEREPRSMQEVQELRNLVGKWLRIRMNHVHESQGVADYIVAKDRQELMFQQLANDAEHSDLLWRLLSGEDPLPFEEWTRRRAGR